MTSKAKFSKRNRQFTKHSTLEGWNGSVPGFVNFISKFLKLKELLILQTWETKSMQQVFLLDTILVQAMTVQFTLDS